MTKYPTKVIWRRACAVHLPAKSNAYYEIHQKLREEVMEADLYRAISEVVEADLSRDMAVR